MNESEKSKNQLLSENLELKRIEKFLRAEVAELWKHIKNIESLPFYRTWLKVASKIRNKSNKPILISNEHIADQEVKLNNVNKLDLEFLFIFSSDSQEIGGLKTAGKLAKDLISIKKWRIKGLALSHNPIINNEDNFFVSTIDEESEIKNIVICGSDTVDKAIELSNKFNSNLILLMMGLDHLFAPNWKESQNYIRAIKNSDLVLCLAPHLADQARLYGAKRVELATLGFDEREFNLSTEVKKNKILVSCRTSPEKGLKFILPSIPLIRQAGWVVVGFGDLPEHEAANAFDRYLGRISAADLNIEFKDTKYLIDPSWIEGLGLVALEAAACGVIPIISARGDYKNLFDEANPPYIEISNFIDPSVLLKILENTNLKYNAQQVSFGVKDLTWDKGLNQSIHILENYI